MKEIIENTSYQIVCKMIDAGLVDSEPDGIDWEFTIQEIIKNNIPLSMW